MGQEYTSNVEETPKSPDQLHGSQVVGKEVGVALCLEGALLPPSLVTQVEDESAERKDHADPDTVDG